MEEENIDLRAYAHVLLRRWKWTLGIAVAVILLGGLINFTTKPLYESTAQFTSTLPNSPIAQLAVFGSNQLATRALQNLGKNMVEPGSTSIAAQVRVTNDPQDRTIYRVTAQADTPQKAAAIANAWVNACVQEGAVKFLSAVSDTKERQAQIARMRLEQANQSLASYLQSNGLSWDQIPFPQLPISNTLRIIYQGSNHSDILPLTQNIEISRLVVEREVAATVYSSLAAEAEQSKIAYQTADDKLQILTMASEPSTPIRSTPVQNLMLVGVIGLAMGILGAFVVDYFDRSGSPA